MIECRNKQDSWVRIAYYQQFVEFLLHLIELLTDPYYNKYAAEGSGDVCKIYYGG